MEKITEEEVLKTINHPEIIEETVKGRLNAYKEVEGRYIKVTYKKLLSDILFISAVEKKR